MIEQESFMDTDVMDIEVIDIRDGENFYFLGKTLNLTKQRNPCKQNSNWNICCWETCNNFHSSVLL